MKKPRVCPHCGQDLPDAGCLPFADPTPKKPEQVPIPIQIDTPEIRSEFRDFCRHRAQGWPKERWTVVAAQRKLAQLAELGGAEALRWLRFTNQEGLKNIQRPFERGSPGNRGAPEPVKTNQQLLREAGLL